jgi:hypothetical protein
VKRSAFLAGILCLLILYGCDQASFMQKMTRPEDESLAKSYIDLLRQSKFEQIENDADQSMRPSNLHETLVKMSSLIPAQEPESIKVVGLHVSKNAESSVTNITFEYQFPEKWLLANVVLQKKGETITIVGFNVNEIPDSLENLNRFTLKNKSFPHYLVLLFAILVPLFSLYVLVLCLRTKIERRKWMWVISIVLGVGKLGINWTSGQLQVMPLSVQIFGAGALAPLYGPWVISVSLPLGAIVFLLRRRKSAGGSDTRYPGVGIDSLQGSSPF